MSDENDQEKPEAVALPNPYPEMAMRTRRSMLGAALAGGGVYGVWRLLQSGEPVDGLPPAFRRTLEFNAGLWSSLSDNARLSPTFPISMAKEPKVNGLIGMAAPLERPLDGHRLYFENMEGRAEPYLTFDELRSRPFISVVTEHRCIEGWSQIVHWEGIPLQDILKLAYPNRFEKAKYLYAETSEAKAPDRKYFVSLDRSAAMHPQTLLCLKMNGDWLTPKHGSPLRLSVPVKYGIKSLKRLHRLALSDVPPKDYWRERGYDDYVGL